MPSVLFVTTVPITLEAFLIPLAEHFRAVGWRVDGLANGAAAAQRIAGVFDHRYDISWSRNPLSPKNVLGTAPAVRRIVAEGGYDLVHVHTPIAAFVTRYALRDRGEPGRPVVVYTAHGFHFYEGGSALRNFVYSRMELLAAPWTDYLVTVNREDFGAAQDLLGVPPQRVRLIPGIGVDTERFSPEAVSTQRAEGVRRELGVDEGAFVLVMVAELAAVKRHAHALEALARVSDPRVVLLLVGTGALGPRLRQKAVALGVSERVRWAGYRRDIPEVLAASDALLLCSEREGLNRSVLEALASGTPVIGTQTRGIADAISPESGWVVPKNDSVALARAIEQAAADPALVARKGVAARERALARFALPRIIGAYEELYREALASRV